VKLVDTESGLHIEIEGEFVIKFDEHRYYKTFSGQGFKGVDYLLVTWEALYLIEIKNFSQHASSRAFAQKELNIQFYQKCEDSLIILEKFYEFLQRGFWTRIFILKYGWYFTGQREWKYWLKAYRLYQQGKVHMILHVQE